MFKTKLSTAGVGILVAVVATLMVWVGFTTAAQEVADEIVIDSKLWPEQKYGDAKFTHKKHATEYKIPCADCHHVYKDGKNVWKEGDPVQRCDECHTCVKTGKDLREASPEEQKLSLYNAYHDNCRGCHKKYNKDHGTRDAPTSCKDCHERKPR